MKSGHHALHSVGVALGFLVLVPPPSHPVWLAGVALAAGVGIDVDHFLIARVKTGSWKNLRRVVERPAMVVFDQEAIFDAGEVGAGERLVSHVLLGGAGTGLLWGLGVRYWAGVVGLALAVHVLADAYDSGRRHLEVAGGPD